MSDRVTGTAGYSGTISDPHLEAPRASYIVQVQRRSLLRILQKPQWQTWKVMAESPRGALRLANSHFCFPRALRVRLLGEE